MASATENNRQVSTYSVRVKMCGKGAQYDQVTGCTGKPHWKQDQIGQEKLLALLALSG